MPFPTRRLARKTLDASVVRIADCIGDPVLRLRFLRAAAPRAHSRVRRWILGAGLLVVLLVPFLMKLAAGKAAPPHIAIIPPRATVVDVAQKNIPVWEVERSGDSEVYSNGLRIDTRWAVANRARSFVAFQRDGGSAVKPVRRSQPAGIVYHTTESCQAPFEAEKTPVLKRLGESMLDYVRRRLAYHYVIDRFGRVYRVVAESDIAYHAGYSVWADDQWFYLNLNDSFLSVSFEAQTHAGRADGVVSPAQVRAAAMLTEMLRSRYQIAAGNCVTHAQVSVNPSNMLVGYHTDWESGFPFEALGLPDNYARPLPSLWAFGFAYEPAWLASGGERMSAGVKLAEQDVAYKAAAQGLRPAVYKKNLREQYRAWLGEVRRAGPPPVNDVPAPLADSHAAGAPAAPAPPYPAERKRMRQYAPAGK